MKFAGSQTIYPCREHETINIPFSALLDESGQLDLYPEIASKGYFDIDFRQGQLCLRSKRVVGLIPISDRVAIHVEPKAPIANLMYMIWRSGVPMGSLAGAIRGYREQIGAITDPEELYVSTFISALQDIRRSGPLKNYRRQQSDSERRGRILIAPTVSRFVSKGLRQRQVFEFHELTVDNLENRILRHTTERLLTRFARDPAGPNQQVAMELRRLLSHFSGVDSSGMNALLTARHAVRLIQSLPGTHRFYEPALWLSYLIATKSGVLMERIGRARFESIVIDVSEVFESYVRRLFQEAATSHFGGCVVLNGNSRQVPLFATTKQFLMQPDYYFRQQQTHVAVADAKYKPKIDTEDRYALIAYCEALNVKKAAFICPQFDNAPLSFHQGTTRSGVEVRVLRIDLAADDMASEEAEFKARVSSALGLV